jgi:adenosylcobyric acid synthase
MKPKAKVVMVMGTASDVGKSVVATALCRILIQDGYQVPPFKAQNMSLNSFAVPDGGEIDRAQVVQAEAARVTPTVDARARAVSQSGTTKGRVGAVSELEGRHVATWH